MQFHHFNIIIFLILTILWHYGTHADDKVNDWLQSNNCLPNAPVALDFCTCKCSEMTAALRKSDMQLEISRRLQLRRSSIRKAQTQTANKDENETLRGEKYGKETLRDEKDESQTLRAKNDNKQALKVGNVDNQALRAGYDDKQALRAGDDDKQALRKEHEKYKMTTFNFKTTDSVTVENFTPGVIKCWDTCVDSLIL